MGIYLDNLVIIFTDPTGGRQTWRQSSACQWGGGGGSRRASAPACASSRGELRACFRTTLAQQQKNKNTEEYNKLLLNVNHMNNYNPLLSL